MVKILELVEVTKTFEGLRAVDGVSLSVEKGSLTGLIGPNGSGKTTLFNVISGVYRPDMGKIYFEGERIDGLPPYKIYEKGLVRSFQIPRLFFNMTTLENGLIPPRKQIGEKFTNAPFHKTWRTQEIKFAKNFTRITNFLNLTSIVGNLASEASGGQMKLLELSRGLMGEPKMLLLDEPTAGVAPKLAREIFEHIIYLRDEYNITFFVVEHRLDLLFDYVEYVFVMNYGKIILQGTPNEIINNPNLIEIYLGE